jgi:hypothetical protein
MRYAFFAGTDTKHAVLGPSELRGSRYEWERTPEQLKGEEGE